MKKSCLRLLAAVILSLTATTGKAQYYAIANQLPNLIQPAISGSLNYKGFVDIDGVAGIGYNRANFVGISTTQGFTYGGWFFMGAGIGVDVAMAHQEILLGNYPGNQPAWAGVPTSKTKAMIPVFSDFRFNFGSPSSTGFFIDLRLGAAWFIGDSYLQLTDVRMTNAAQFYLRPTIGIRIPVNSKQPNQAVNIGVTYQLLTSDNYYSYWRDNNPTLNGLGFTIGYEW